MQKFYYTTKRFDQVSYYRHHQLALAHIQTGIYIGANLEIIKWLL
jgi:hypothetical protein